MGAPKDLIKAIDHQYQLEKDLGPERFHLGASVIGGKCARQGWYAFRRAKVVKHTGRILRLFDRGHDEEARFLRYLSSIGVEVRSTEKRLIHHDGTGDLVEIYWDEEFPPDCDDVTDILYYEGLAKLRKLPRRQWGFVGYKGHFKGNSDGKAAPEALQHYAPFELIGWGLLEFKTHNDKSYKDLVAKGVLTSKTVHYVQMQTYMRKLGLRWALYLAVNKNDDSLHHEFIQYREEIAAPYEGRAVATIDADKPPQRYSNDPSWFECKFCDFREICHYDEPMLKSCRTCCYGGPADEGQWACRKFDSIVPKDFHLKGCDQYEEIKG